MNDNEKFFFSFLLSIFDKKKVFFEFFIFQKTRKNQNIKRMQKGRNYIQLGQKIFTCIETIKYHIYLMRFIYISPNMRYLLLF